MELNRVIAVRNGKTVYRDGDKCIKVFDSDYSTADVLNEAHNQARVEGCGLDIPRVIEVTTIDGKWAIVSEYIEGRDMGRLMEEHPEKKEEFLEQLVDLQFKVQSVTGMLLHRLTDKLDRQISQCDLEATTRVDMHNQLMAIPRRSKLCHGDFVPANVMVRGDGSLCVLDWSHAAVGHGSADAAITALRFRLKGEDELADRYLDLYCDKTGDRREYMNYIGQWTPLAAAALSVKVSGSQREYLLSLVD